MPAFLVLGALLPVRMAYRWIRRFDRSAGGQQGPFKAGQTARTGGIARVEGRALPGNAQGFTIDGEIGPGMFRGQGPAPAGRVKAPSFEHRMPTGSRLGLPNYERAHLWGPGFGDEARAGIMYAPDTVNRELQSLGQDRGIEGWIRGLGDDALGLGGQAHVRATAASHPRVTARDPLLLKEAQYEVAVVVPGQPTRVYRAHIGVGPPPRGNATVEIAELVVNP